MLNITSEDLGEDRETKKERMKDWRKKINNWPAYDRERTGERGRCRERRGKKGLQRMKNKEKKTTSAKACLSCARLFPSLVSAKSLLDNKGKG